MNMMATVSTRTTEADSDLFVGHTFCPLFHLFDPKWFQQVIKDIQDHGGRISVHTDHISSIIIYPSPAHRHRINKDVLSEFDEPIAGAIDPSLGDPVNTVTLAEQQQHQLADAPPLRALPTTETLHLSSIPGQRMVTSTWVAQCLSESRLCDLNIGWNELYMEDQLGLTRRRYQGDHEDGKTPAATPRKKRLRPTEGNEKNESAATAEASAATPASKKRRRRTLRAVKPADKVRFDFTAAVLTQWRGKLCEFFAHVDDLLSTQQSTLLQSTAKNKSNHRSFSRTSSFFRKYRSLLEPCFNPTMVAHLEPHAHRKIDEEVMGRRQGSLNTPLSAIALERNQQSDRTLDAWRKTITQEANDDHSDNIAVVPETTDKVLLLENPTCDGTNIYVTNDDHHDDHDHDPHHHHDHDNDDDDDDDGNSHDSDIPNIDNLEPLLLVALRLNTEPLVRTTTTCTGTSSGAASRRSVTFTLKPVVERLLGCICQMEVDRQDATDAERCLHIFRTKSGSWSPTHAPTACGRGRAIAIRPWYLPLFANDMIRRDDRDESVTIMLYYLSARPAVRSRSDPTEEEDDDDEPQLDYIVDGGEIWTVGLSSRIVDNDDEVERTTHLARGVWTTLASVLPRVRQEESRLALTWRDFEWPIDFLYELLRQQQQQQRTPERYPHTFEGEGHGVRIEHVKRRPDPLVTDQDKARQVLAALISVKDV